MFMNSEIIVGLLFVPVVLFIFIPLSMLCVWTFVQLLRKIVKIHKTTEEAQSEPYIARLHSSSVA